MYSAVPVLLNVIPLQVNPAIPLTRSMPDPMSQRTQLTELDALKVPPVFASARNALYTRFTPNDWMASNQSNYLASDRVRSGAERLRLDTVRLCRFACLSRLCLFVCFLFWFFSTFSWVSEPESDEVHILPARRTLIKISLYFVLSEQWEMDQCIPVVVDLA